MQGLATEGDCVFVLRDGVQSLAEELLDLARRVPGSISNEAETSPGGSLQESMDEPEIGEQEGSGT